MTLPFDQGWMVATVLLWVRLGALFVASPIFTSVRAPLPFIVLLTLTFAGVLVTGQGLRASASAVAPLGFAVAVATEAVIGAMLGFAMQSALSAVAVAGQLLDVQLGFSMGAIFNPVTAASSSVLGSTLSLFAAVYFFASDAHLALFQGVVYSVEAVPLGSAWFVTSTDLIVRPVAAMFTAAITVFAPALFILLMVEVAAMVTSRALPQMNVFFVAVPAKTLIGLVVLAATAPFIAPSLGRAYAAAFKFWSEVLR